MDVLYINQEGLVEPQVVQLHTTPLFLELVKWCKHSLRKKERKKVEDVVSKYPDMPLLFLLSPFSSQVCLPSAPVEEGLSGAAESV